jgi:hypothetical protein
MENCITRVISDSERKTKPKNYLTREKESSTLLVQGLLNKREKRVEPSLS